MGNGGSVDSPEEIVTVQMSERLSSSGKHATLLSLTVAPLLTNSVHLKLLTARLESHDMSGWHALW